MKGARPHTDIDVTVKALRENRERDEQSALYWIAVALRDNGPMYSRQLRDYLGERGLDFTVARVWNLLMWAQNEGHLVSEIRYPPFPDCPSGGIIRRYFALKDEA